MNLAFCDGDAKGTTGVGVVDELLMVEVDDGVRWK